MERRASLSLSLEQSDSLWSEATLWVLDSEAGVKNRIFQFFIFTIKIGRDLVEIDPEAVILKNLTSDLALTREN